MKVNEHERAATRTSPGTSVERKSLVKDCLQYFREYARANPETTALWCFGIGFVIGWKLKPW